MDEGQWLLIATNIFLIVWFLSNVLLDGLFPTPTIDSDLHLRVGDLENRIENLEEQADNQKQQVKLTEMNLDTIWGELFGVEGKVDEEGREVKGLVDKFRDLQWEVNFMIEAYSDIEDVLYGDLEGGKGLIEDVYEGLYGGSDKKVDCEDCGGNLSKCDPNTCTKPTTFSFEDTDLEPEPDVELKFEGGKWVPLDSPLQTVDQSVIPSLLKDKVEALKVLEQKSVGGEIVKGENN